MIESTQVVRFRIEDRTIIVYKKKQPVLEHEVVSRIS